MTAPHRASCGRSSMSRRRERGVVLLGAVAALGALALVATGVATTAAIDRRRTADALESLQADALARSAVTTAAVLLGDQARSGEPDSPRSPWAHPLGRQTIGPGWGQVTLADDARRRHLNRPGAHPAPA